MLWCELHHASGVKGGITNFDPSEYEGDLAHLQSISQVKSASIGSSLQQLKASMLVSCSACLTQSQSKLYLPSCPGFEPACGLLILV